MRIALAGKGGVGKTTTAATLARVFARMGRPVVVIDADSNPNVGSALGMPPEAVAELTSLPPSLVSRRLGGPALVEPVEAVLDRYGRQAPDGVRVCLMGMPTHADEGCLCSAHATVSGLLGDLAERRDTVTIVDLEASPEHLGRGTTRHVDVLLFVTEPYYRSLETVRRMAELAAELPIPRSAVIANKVRSASDAQAVEEFCARHGLELLGCIPRSDVVVDADVAGVPLLDHDDDNEVVAAIATLAERLLTTDAALR